MIERALEHRRQTRPVEHFRAVRYWLVAFLLFVPWFLVLNHYSEGGRIVFGSRASLIAFLASTLTIGVAYLRLLVGKPAGWGHVSAVLSFLFILIFAFVATLEGASLVGHWLARESFGKVPPGPLLSLIGSSFYVFYIVVAFVVVRWYSILPLVGASYAVLSWAGAGGRRKAA